jgi:tRNA pseudouridine55 synthase
VPLDKPKGMSSFGVVKKLRWLLGKAGLPEGQRRAKVGHAGTLDPMATGLLLCLVGKATKEQDAFMEMRKVYTGTLRLGQTTASFDAETPVEEERDASGVTGDDLDAARAQFTGPITQLAPMYSAVKVGGERLYKKARRGETVEREPRRVEVYSFDLTARRGADVDFRVACSKGTYIRSLAHDLGQALGVGAHLTALRREAIGEYEVGAAWTLDALEAALLAPREGTADSQTP